MRAFQKLNNKKTQPIYIKHESIDFNKIESSSDSESRFIDQDLYENINNTRDS